jgi:uncharacterized membrane protein
MSYKTYKIIRTALIIAIAILVAWSVAAGRVETPVISVILGIVLLFFLRRQVKEVVADERAYNIYHKASSMAFRLFALLAAVTGGTLLAMKGTASPVLEQIGFTLAYSAAGMVLIYYIAYIFYSRKMGGKE